MPEFYYWVCTAHGTSAKALDAHMPGACRWVTKRSQHRWWQLRWWLS